MGNIVPFVDILIFAIIAIFLVIRLRSMLGTRDGYEQSPEETGQNRPHPVEEAEQAKIVPLHPESLSGSGIKAIQEADPSFSEDGFLQGASAAFSMILQAFAEGDLSQLRRLLGYDLFNEFSEAIRERNADGETLSIHIQSIDEASIADAELVDGIASVTVRFVSQQTRQYRSMTGDEIVDEAAPAGPIIDLWVFERDVQLADPNWKLVETSTENEDA